MPAAPARGAGASEYQLKAAFLFNFLQFVDWPPAVFESPSPELVIGILGPDPFASALDDIMRGEHINGVPIVIRRFARAEDVDRCQLLFVNQAGEQLQRALDLLKGRPILTVGDADAFTDHGGMVRFVIEDNRIRLHVNLAAATDAQLRLSSKLLRRSQIVTSAQG